MDKTRIYSHKRRLHFALIAIGLILFPTSVMAAGEVSLGERLPLWSVIPFVGILLSIALCEAVAPHFWHNHYGKVVVGWAMLLAVPFLMIHGIPAFHEILHIYLLDYLPFIILLWGLFTIGGGIVVKGSLPGTPGSNTGILFIGTILASLIGTTGASMILIRPMLRANAHRRYNVHIMIFMIFLISNIGGVLTPLGDPPLFLGFLHGVPFFWTLRLLPHLAVAAAILLSLFFIMDTILYKRELGHLFCPDDPLEPVRIAGGINILLLGGVLGAVLMSGLWHPGAVTIGGVSLGLQDIARDLIIVLMGLLSLAFTPPGLRAVNRFTWFPMIQVVHLFAGIFMTIIPVILILKAGAHGALSFALSQTNSPGGYFWITGMLSGFLDNAPTYLTLFTSASGQFGLHEDTIRQALALPPDQWGNLMQGGRTVDPDTVASFVASLKAISVGATFMGANTYIGNAPNLMVKAIAEENHVRMPNFIHYMAYTGTILIPLFGLLHLLFFR